MVSLDSCNGSFNTLDDLSARLCASSETEDIYLKVFNMITEIMNQNSS